ncbi:calcium-binding protein [Roseomonas sp. CCTCC AB2023176]|uniref:calcium-binding protein n=1 Tax=Roseomonas sp. CCTCC AB2023176 TaxID=3342640 RepID=UPI0035DE8D72
MTIFIGTNAGDTIKPGLISSGVIRLGPHTTPGDGDDTIIARAGDDVVAGGRGSDTALLGAGNDVFGWAPADGSDTVSGQAGFDRLDFDGDDSRETFTLRAQGNEARLDRDVDSVTMRLSGMERIDLFAGGGADVVRVNDMAGSGVQEVRIDLSGTKGAGTGDGMTDNVVLSDGGNASFVTLLGDGGAVSVIGLDAFVRIASVEAQDGVTFKAGGGDDVVSASGVAGGVRLTLDGGAGDDQLTGGQGNDTLLGGTGDDFIIGGRGDDVSRLGAGDDVFVWNNGDGSDRVEGEAGDDDLAFNGFAADEAFVLEASGERALLTRDLGNIRMKLNDVEGVTIRADGGADRIAIGDLSSTEVSAVEIALSLPGRAGDGAADVISLTGSAEGDTVDVISGAGSLITVEGLPAAVSMFGVEAQDMLSVTGGSGDDIIRTREVAIGAPRLLVDGGAGLDFLFGGDNDESFSGGDGDDGLFSGGGDDGVFGGRGDDFARLGTGNDRFTWIPGDGNDFVDGEAGTDTLAFDGSGTTETIEIIADGATAVLVRDVGAVRMDLVDVERTDVRTFGGTDEVRVGDMTGTDLDEIVIDLGGPDGAADLIVVDGTGVADTVTIGLEEGVIVIEGLAATIRILGAEAGLDQLLFRGFEGDDVVNASSLAGIGLFVQGGEGDDVIIGSAGADVLSGDGGSDIIIGSTGNDRLLGNLGDDFLDGGDGLDTLTPGGGQDILLNGEITGGSFVADAFLF